MTTHLFHVIRLNGQPFLSTSIEESKMRRDFLKTAVAAGAGMASLNAFAQTANAVGLRGNPNDTYVMNVMVSGVEYWFPVYEMFKQ